jgi:hypothetical protein
LSGALLALGLVDELLLYFAPSLLGDTARGMFALPPLASLDAQIRLDIREVKQVGSDWRMLAARAASETVVLPAAQISRTAMFTGIVAATGRVTRATPLTGSDAGMRIEVDTGSLDCTDVAIGDSVAVSGVCLTVIER